MTEKESKKFTANPQMNYEWKHTTGGGWHKEYPTFQTKNCKFAEPVTNNCLYQHPCEFKDTEFCRLKLSKLEGRNDKRM